MSNIIECHKVSKYFRKESQGIKQFLVGKPNKLLKKNKFSRAWALESLTFNIERGTAFGIVGHNGSGKSTLLSLILGSIKPDRGYINLYGKVSSLLELGAGFHPDLTGKENIFLNASILGMRLSEIKKKYKLIVDFSELGDALENPLRTYSSGMIARLGFSIIIQAKADVLLIDEVLAVGDAGFRSKCMDYLHKFKSEGGTLVIVSHEMTTILDICDDAICLNEGKLLFYGTVGDVVKNYDSMMIHKIC